MLRVWTNDTDTVIAENVSDVKKVIEELHGSWEDSDDDWRVVPDDKVITICNWDDKGPDSKKAMTAAEWIESEGRGFLCSTEW